MPSFKCQDIGMNCGFQANADTQQEIMNKIMQHAKEDHGMQVMSQEDMEKVKKAIKVSV